MKKPKIKIEIESLVVKKLYYRVVYSLHSKNCFGDLPTAKHDPTRIHREYHIDKKIGEILMRYQKSRLMDDKLSIRQAKNLANKLADARIYGKPILRNIKIIGYYE